MHAAFLLLDRALLFGLTHQRGKRALDLRTLRGMPSPPLIWEMVDSARDDCGTLDTPVPLPCGCEGESCVKCSTWLDSVPTGDPRSLVLLESPFCLPPTGRKLKLWERSRTWDGSRCSVGWL